LASVSGLTAVPAAPIGVASASAIRQEQRTMTLSCCHALNVTLPVESVITASSERE
jgi:hypothetical protein